jgi:hypothetical protein
VSGRTDRNESETRQAKKVDEITDSDYFKQLRGQADDLRKIMEEPAE